MLTCCTSRTTYQHFYLRATQKKKTIKTPTFQHILIVGCILNRCDHFQSRGESHPPNTVLSRYRPFVNIGIRASVVVNITIYILFHLFLFHYQPIRPENGSTSSDQLFACIFHFIRFCGSVQMNQVIHCVSIVNSFLGLMF